MDKVPFRKQDAKPHIVVGMHGQWMDINEFGPVLRKGCFRFPLFGDSTFEGEMLNGRRFGNGVQVLIGLLWTCTETSFTILLTTNRQLS